MDLIGPWINQVHGRPYQFEVKNSSQEPKPRFQVKNPSQEAKPIPKTQVIFVVCLLACLLVCLTNSAWRMTPCHNTELTEAEPPQKIANAKEYIDEASSIAMHAMRAGIHSTLGSSPRSLTFNRDMFLNMAYGYFVLLAVCSAICSANFGFFLPGRTLNG